MIPIHGGAENTAPDLRQAGARTQHGSGILKQAPGSTLSMVGGELIEFSAPNETENYSTNYLAGSDKGLR